MDNFSHNQQIESSELDNNSSRAQRISVLSPRETLYKYISYIPMYLIFCLICAGIATFYLRYQVKLYNCSIKILIKEDDKQQDKTEIINLLTGKEKSNLANETEILKSHTLIEKVVKELNLCTKCAYNGKFSQTEIYDSSNKQIVTFSEIRDSNQTYNFIINKKNKKLFFGSEFNKVEISPNKLIKTKDFNFYINNKYFNQDGNYLISWTPVDIVVSKLIKNINVKPLNKESSILLMNYETNIPIKGKMILNNLTSQYINFNIEDKNRTIDNTIKFVDDRLILISGELGNVENDLKTYRKSNDVIDLSAQNSSSFTRLTNLKEQIDQSEIKLKIAEMLFGYVSNGNSKFRLVPTPLGIKDVTLISLISRYNEDIIKREELLKTIPSTNMIITSLESEIEDLRIKLVEALSNIRKSIKSGSTYIKSEYDGIISNIKDIPEKQKALLEIERQQGIKEKLYLYLLEKREESAINRASAVSNSFPIDPATVPFESISLSKTAVYGMALVLGIALTSFIIFLQFIFNDKIVSKEDITLITDIPIIGEISNYKESERRIVSTKNRGLIPEQFRIVRTNINYFTTVPKKCKVILITSTMPGEGKTFISMNIAATLSLTNKRVALLEFDLRKPKIASNLKIDTNNRGLSTYLTSITTTVDEISCEIPDVFNCYLIPTGPTPPNPAELLLTQRMDQLFDELREKFDYVVIDTSPIGIVSDAKVLSKYSDINFYVVRQRYTFKRQLTLINDFYKSKFLDNLALIINDVVMDGSQGYYGYSRSYGYASGYGYGGYGYGGYYGGYTYDHSYTYGYNNDKDNDKSKLIDIFKRKKKASK